MKDLLFSLNKKSLTRVSFVALAASCLIASAKADPAPPLLAVGPQAPDQILPGSSATYAVTISEKALGLINGLVCSNLPAGATASLSAVTVARDAAGSPAKTATLTITTQPTTPPGTYTFTLTRPHQSNGIQVNSTGTLVIGAIAQRIIQPPVILSIQMLPARTVQVVCSGSSGGTYWLQATTSLSSPSWSVIDTNVADASGLVTFIDNQAPNYPLRFYRAQVGQ